MSEAAVTPLPSWADQLQALSDVVDNLLPQWRPDGVTEAERQDMNKLALSILANGYLCRVYTNASRPVFMPLWNYACNQGGPDPDYVYSQTEIDSSGVYRISGFRGTNRFVEISLQAGDMMASAASRAASGVAGTGAAGGKPLAVTYDLDDIEVDERGYFSAVLSAERPEGYDGIWWELDPRTRKLLMRRCACDWKNEEDARIAIERLDSDGVDMSPEEIARRFADMPKWIQGMIEFDMELVRWYREHHGVNEFMRSKKIDSMGGLKTQAYYDGIHEITDDEALILETELPAKVRYWQALVADDRFCTVDWVNRQSSLNDVQAHIDSDGKFRAVISRLDPGVPNWLDKADYPWGIIQMRWNRASDHPDPTMIKVPFADVRKHLPADTPVVTPEERRENLRIRREGAQLRRIW